MGLRRHQPPPKSSVLSLLIPFLAASGNPRHPQSSKLLWISSLGRPFLVLETEEGEIEQNPDGCSAGMFGN